MANTKLSDLKLGRKRIVIKTILKDINYGIALEIQKGAMLNKKFIIKGGNLIYEEGKFSHMKLELVLEW